MRSNISDQDLTDYALNELESNDRLYVESMLAVSEECRHDVYQMIDLAMLLEETFEREDAKATSLLRPEQRHKVLTMRPRPHYIRRAVAGLAAAAAIALAVTHPGFWQVKGSAHHVAQASTQAARYVVSAVTSSDDAGDISGQLANWKQLAEDPVLTKWFSSEWFAADHAGQSASSMPSWDPMPRVSFDAMP